MRWAMRPSREYRAAKPGTGPEAGEIQPFFHYPGVWIYYKYYYANTSKIGDIDMRIIRSLIPVLVIVCLVFQASSQGYAGTTTSGSGIQSPLIVGSGASNATGAESRDAIGTPIAVGTTAETGSSDAIGTPIAVGTAAAIGSTDAIGTPIAIGSGASKGSSNSVGTPVAIGPTTAIGSGSAIGPTNAVASSQTSLSGTWSMDLVDTTLRHLVLNMQQSGDALMGDGNITEDNGAKGVTAQGSVSGGNINLTLSTVDGSEIYRLELLESGTTIRGGYNAQSTSGSVRSGTVTGGLGASTSNGKGPVMLGVDLGQVPSVNVKNSSMIAQTMQGATAGYTQTNRTFYSTYSQGQVSTSDTTSTTNYG
jgi:hypothetical protein